MRRKNSGKRTISFNVFSSLGFFSIISNKLVVIWLKNEKDESKDDKKPKKQSDLKKFLNKRSFIYLSAAVFFVVFIVPDMIAPSDLEKKLVENLESDEQNIAWSIVKSYRGSDDSGNNLFDAIITQRENAYPTEKNT